MFVRRSWLQLLILAPLALMMVGCMKKCPVPKERQPNITATEWRLVETSDPDPDYQNNVSKFTFVIFRFGQDFNGDVKKVVNNTLYDAPIRTFAYDVEPSSNFLRVKYAFPEGAEKKDSTQSDSTSTGDDPIDYYYDLGRQLVLTSQEGYRYRFVPFTGILSPDEVCEF